MVNGLCVDNVTDNCRYRKKASKAYAEVVSGAPNATDFNVEMKDIKVNEGKFKYTLGNIISS